MSRNTKSFIWVLVIVVIVAGGMIFLAVKTKNKPSTNTNPVAQNGSSVENNALNPDHKDAGYIERLAKYLTKVGMVFYGASWCPHCKDQKAVFGDSLKYVNYVECSTSSNELTAHQTDQCTNHAPFVDATEGSSTLGQSFPGIQGYPTWIYQGKGYSGEMTIAELAQISGFTDADASSAQ